MHFGRFVRLRQPAAAVPTLATLRAEALCSSSPRHASSTGAAVGHSPEEYPDLFSTWRFRPSPFTDFLNNVKEVEATTEIEWLGHIARIGRGDHLETVTTEEFDDAGNVTKRTTRTTTSHRPAWQAFAWLLERRHPERWARTERLPATDGSDTLDPEEVIARGEAQMRVIEGGQK